MNALPVALMTHMGEGPWPNWAPLCGATVLDSLAGSMRVSNGGVTCVVCLDLMRKEG